MNSKKYVYGSFNRPLDFLSKGDISQPFEIGHNPLPIKSCEPFSIIMVETTLTEDEIHQYELKPVVYDKCRMCYVSE